MQNVVPIYFKSVAHMSKTAAQKGLTAEQQQTRKRFYERLATMRGHI
jgi:hypothetical protein